jgi:hypothetical protein
MAMLITAFIIALFIFFGVYYEKDKKIIEQRGKTRARIRNEDFIIFPFLDENRNDAPHTHEDHFEE